MEPRIAQDSADFRELREKGYIYVDKTEQLYRLANGIDIGGKLFALQLRHDEGGDPRALHATICGASLPFD